MKRTARTAIATVLATLALAVGAATCAAPATAQRSPDPNHALDWTQQVKQLRDELKAATITLQERRLINHEIQQIRLDAS